MCCRIISEHLLRTRPVIDLHTLGPARQALPILLGTVRAFSCRSQKYLCSLQELGMCVQWGGKGRMRVQRKFRVLIS